MAKKVLLRDWNNDEVLPITRGELVLDSSGKEAFRSNEFLATTSQPGLMSVEDKFKIDNIEGIGNIANDKVSQVNTTTSDVYRLLFSETADDETRTEGARKSAKLTFNPSTGVLQASGLIGNIDGTYVNKLTGYNKATLISDVTSEDTLISALGKVELRAEVAYNLIQGAYDGDGTIENLAEILKVLEGISDTETIQSIVGKYLPLSGGTIMGSSGSLSVARTDADQIGIGFKGISGLLGYLGFSANGIPAYIEGNGRPNTLIHSGNIGEQSVANAKTLDSYSQTDFARFSISIGTDTSYYRHIGYGTAENGFPKNGGVIVAGGNSGAYKMLLHGRNGVFSFNTMENGTLTGWKRVAFTDSDITGNAGSADVIAKTYANQSINFANNESKIRLISSTSGDVLANGFPVQYVGGISVLSSYVGWQMVAYGSAGIPNPYYRQVSDKGVWGDWKQLAFLTDNVASATKLQTARTIWGQSFDGSANVSGDIHLNQSDIYWHNDKANYSIESVIREAASPYLKIAHYGGIRFQVAGTELMRIEQSGNILIGTTEDNGAKLQVNGDISSTNLWPIITISKSLTITSDWTDTGITFSAANFPHGNGSYMVQIDHGNCYFYTGVISVVINDGAVTANDVDEIILHGGGFDSAVQYYLRTKQDASSKTTKIQIATSGSSHTKTVNFKFKRII